MKGVEKEHCKVSIAKLVLENLFFYHSGLDQACPVLDTGESSLWISEFLPEFTPYLIGGRNDTIYNERIQFVMLNADFPVCDGF